MATKIIRTTPALPGIMATFAVDTDLVAPYKYLWMKDGAYIAGANSAKSYTTPPLVSKDFTSKYSCRVYGQNATEESDGIMLDPKVPSEPITISNVSPPHPPYAPYVDPSSKAKAEFDASQAVK